MKCAETIFKYHLRLLLHFVFSISGLNMTLTTLI